MALNETLAAANAGLTAGSLACMGLGWRAIRAGREREHRNWMLAATGLAAVFLVLFGARFYLYGVTPFRGTSTAAKVFFYIVYFTHEPLAVVNAALVGAAVILGLKDMRAQHREVALWALPVWVYVSVTGLLLYVLLYAPIFAP